jgi:uncharacterized integral membrane protein
MPVINVGPRTVPSPPPGPAATGPAKTARAPWGAILVGILVVILAAVAIVAANGGVARLQGGASTAPTPAPLTVLSQTA